MNEPGAPRRISLEDGSIDFYRSLVSLCPIHVFQDSPGAPVEFFALGRPMGWVEQKLLQCRDRGDADAEETFWVANHFIFVDSCPQREDFLLREFFSSFSVRQAGKLCHLSLSFPSSGLAQHPGSEATASDGNTLQRLRESCTNLHTLEFLVYRTNAAGLVRGEPRDAEVVWGVLDEVDHQLRTISSLKQIIVRYHYDGPGTEVMAMMQERGWIVLMRDDELEAEVNEIDAVVESLEISGFL